jgi:chromosome partitioning protein
MKIVAVCNQKGGVGKTTLTINLGAALADQGYRVLLIDLDPQGHLTEGVGMAEAYLSDGPSLHDCLVTNNKGVKIADLIQKHPAESYSVIPSTYHMMLVEQGLFMSRNREHKLKTLLAQIDGQFDWVIIDCPPALGNLTDNALNAARNVVVPIKADRPSVRALDLLFDQIESLERGLNIHVSVLAIVPNEVLDSSISKRILADLHEKIPVVTPFEFRKRVILQAAWDAGCSIFGYKPSSRSDETNRSEVADLYRRLADFVISQSREAPDHGG